MKIFQFWTFAEGIFQARPRFGVNHLKSPALPISICQYRIISSMSSTASHKVTSDVRGNLSIEQKCQILSQVGMCCTRKRICSV